MTERELLDGMRELWRLLDDPNADPSMVRKLVGKTMPNVVVPRADDQEGGEHG